MPNPVQTFSLSGASFAVCLSACSAASGAQPPSLVVANSGRQPTAGFETQVAPSGERRQVDVFTWRQSDRTSPGGGPWIEYVARQRTTRGAEQTEAWTTSLECPALANIVVWMTTLRPPQMEIAGVLRFEAGPIGPGRRPFQTVADGFPTTVWGYGSQSDGTRFSRVEMQASAGPISEFGRSAQEALEPCWRSTPPDF